MSTVPPGRTVTRGDIEAKLQQIKEFATPNTEAATDTGRGLLVGGAILVVLIAFLLGRRRGRKRNTIVEIRRL